ncbi:MAG: zf-TFIIB domain-containing protein [Cyanothece sp. SIO1E1]|nr:zf-TFIIB domain-containing protein [Cyanothece sp. SIO1E1]
MLCPKNNQVGLVDQTLDVGLAVKCCPDCRGTWIPSAAYESWQAGLPSLPEPNVEAVLSKNLDVDFVQSSLDTRASLCPACGRYLSRAKVNFKTPFYVERCSSCGGIWCDLGEWDILKKLGLHTCIEQLFSSEWQARVREYQHAKRERQAMIEKLGEDLASQVFQLAQRLEAHPDGDFGIAYLIRQFGEIKGR